MWSTHTLGYWSGRSIYLYIYFIYVLCGATVMYMEVVGKNQPQWSQRYCARRLQTTFVGARAPVLDHMSSHIVPQTPPKKIWSGP